MSRERHRVLYVQKPKGGGSATGLYELVRCLDRDRVDPTVLFYEPNEYCDAFAELGAKVLVLNDGPGAPGNGSARLSSSLGRLMTPSHGLGQFKRLVRLDWPLARRIAEVIRAEEVDLVHNNDNPRGDRASMIAARMAHVPQVSHVRFLPQYYRPIDHRLARFVKFFIYMSEAIEEHYRNEVGVPASMGRVIYDPFDLDTFRNGVQGARAVREEFGLAPDDPLITNVGRLVPWKGQDVFSEAFSRIVARLPRARALIVGSPPPNRVGEEYHRRLRGIVERLQLQDHVMFTGFRKDIPEILAASDVVVHSATSPEPFGRIVVEALAAGRPTVATAAGGVPEIVEHEKTGLLVPPGDAERMAEAIEALLRDPDAAARMGSAARRDVAVRFARGRFSRAIQHIYGLAIDARAAWKPKQVAITDAEA